MLDQERIFTDDRLEYVARIGAARLNAGFDEARRVRQERQHAQHADLFAHLSGFEKLQYPVGLLLLGQAWKRLGDQPEPQVVGQGAVRTRRPQLGWRFEAELGGLAEPARHAREQCAKTNTGRLGQIASGALEEALGVGPAPLQQLFQHQLWFRHRP